MRIFYLLIVLLIGECCYGQLFNNITRFSTEDGLSNNTVTCIEKDAEGFLWIGTHEGLNRYDGTEFTNVLSNERNNLPSNNITSLQFINKTLLAVGTDAGLCFLNTGTFTGKKIILPFNKKFSSSGYYIQSIMYNESTSELWACTWQGLFVLNVEGKLMNGMMANEKDISNGFFAKYLFTDAQGHNYFFSQQKAGFYYADFSDKKLIPAEEKMPAFKLNDFVRKGFTLRSAENAGTESLCIFSKSTSAGEGEYLSYTNTKTGKSFIKKINANVSDDKRLYNAFVLNDSVILINSFFGEPYFYNVNSDEVKRASDKPLWFTSWPDGFEASLFKDGENIWVATSKGLVQSSLKTILFKNNATLINTINEDKSVVSYNCAIYNKNTFWIACLGAGLLALDTVTNKIMHVFDKTTPSIFTKKLISTEVLNAGNNLWLFSLYGPVQVSKTSKKLMLPTGLNKDSAFDEFANYPLKDGKGNIWTSLPDGIAKYNIAKDSFTNYKTKHEGGQFPVTRAGVKTEDGKGNIWIVRRDTLVEFDSRTQTFSATVIKKEGHMLQSINAIASDGDDVLYMSVADAFGIYHISTGSIDLYLKQTGIISTAINAMETDKAGNVWIATEGGLVYYDKQKVKFSSFTKADGLPDDDITGLNFTDTAKNILFLGFPNTYCLFQPAFFLLDKNVPQNRITHVEVDGESLPFDITPTLSYNQNNISFTYTGINYNQGRQNNYACMLTGFDNDWKYTGTERKVNYINLSPGKYTFKVKSANHQGEWNEQPAVFSFEITYPFWQRWWFIALLIAFVFFTIYYFIKNREAAIRKQNYIKLQMSELRMQALRAQMNPHFIFNSLNSIQNYILNNNTIDAAAYLSKFAKLMRRILDQSKHNFLPLGEVIETLKMYVEIEAFRFSNEFTYTFDIEDDDDLLDARIPPMLLQPFVENAILHGLMPKSGDKQLSIRCCIVQNHIEIIIEDNGVGRTQPNAKAGHTSQGEKLTAGMLESMQHIQNSKASIDIIDKTENEMPAGTIVKLLLPLK